MTLPHANAMHALVREIPDSFDHAIKPRSSKERIDVKLAQRQHQAYCDLLKSLGLHLIALPGDAKHPDCCFTEDTALVYDELAIIGKFGPKSRRGEETAVAKALSKYRNIRRIRAPGTLEGGDALKVGDTTYIGKSRRTNPSGIRQLSRYLGEKYQVVAVPVSGILHLKTGINYLGNNFVAHKTGVPMRIFRAFRIVQVPNSELRKASFLPVRGKIVVPADCPKTIRLVKKAGFDTIPFDNSEIRKAQAGLTCLSIIF